MNARSLSLSLPRSYLRPLLLSLSLASSYAPIFSSSLPKVVETLALNGETFAEVFDVPLVLQIRSTRSRKLTDTTNRGQVAVANDVRCNNIDKNLHMHSAELREVKRSTFNFATNSSPLSYASYEIIRTIDEDCKRHVFSVISRRGFSLKTSTRLGSFVLSFISRGKSKFSESIAILRNGIRFFELGSCNLYIEAIGLKSMCVSTQVS